MTGFSRRTVLCGALTCFAGVVCADFKKPSEPTDVPELLRTAAGERVTTREQWERVRRPELLKVFTENEYGVRPVERPADLRFEQVRPDEDAFGGRAVKKLVRGAYSGPGGEQSFVFAAWIPRSSKRVPAFIHVSPRPADTAADRDGPRPSYYLPADYITSRGYAAIASCDYDFSLDCHQLPDEPTNGVFKAYGPKSMKGRKPTEWGILSAWSWGASRILDWIETEPSVDARHVGVVGLSRNGKTALCAGVLDTRFALAVSCCSGCCGAKLNHMDCPGSETLAPIMDMAWPWFCPALSRWIGRDREMPFDQHQWLALMAPRLLYVSSATEDAWAGPRGEFASARLASPVWELYGKAGLVEHGFPAPDRPLHAGNIGYHVRSGLHDITRSDWENYLDFADGHGWRQASATSKTGDDKEKEVLGK